MSRSRQQRQAGRAVRCREIATMAARKCVYTAQISKDALPVHPWCFDDGVQNYPGRNLPRIVTDVVNAFRGNPEVSVLPHPDRIDLLYQMHIV